MSAGLRRLSLLLCALALVVAPVFASPARALGADDVYEPDDTLAQAGQLPTDGTAQAHWFEGQGVGYQGVDWLRFEAQAGHVYDLKIWRGTVWSLPRPTFHYADGTPIPDESGYGATEWYFYADHDGPIFIQLLQPSWSETGSYFVSLQGGAASEFGLADEYEPDNTVRSAKEIPVDGTVQRRFSDEPNVDLVRFPVHKNMVYRVDVSWEWGSEYMLASVVETNGAVVLAEDFVNQRARVRYFTATSDGMLYLKCRLGIKSAPYLVSITELERSTLSGRVTRVVGGEPVNGAQVRIYDSDPAGTHYASSSTMISTDSDGTWSLPVQPGAYVALFEDPAGDLLGEFYGGGLPSDEVATPIIVGEQQTIATIDGRLWATADIDGVVALSDGTPVGGSVVTLDYVQPGSWSWWWKTIATQTSHEDGSFSFTRLDPRLSYRMTATPVGTDIPDAPTGAALTTGHSTEVTLALYPPGSISGLVTDARSGAPLEGIQVEVWGGGGGQGQLGQTASTGADGHYRVSGLVSGSYRLRFVDPAGPEGLYGEDFWGASEYGWEDLIPVTISQDTAGIDFKATVMSSHPTSVTLSSGASTISYGGSSLLTAVVRDNEGNGIAGAALLVERYAGGGWATVASMTAGSTGIAKTYVKPVSRTRYRVSYPGSGVLGPASSPERTVAVRAYVGTPNCPKSARPGRTFTAIGYLKPRHEADKHSVVLYCYQSVRGRWALKKKVAATNQNYSSYTRYRARLSLAKGRWRIRASHGDLGHTSRVSAYRYLTLR